MPCFRPWLRPVLVLVLASCALLGGGASRPASPLSIPRFLRSAEWTVYETGTVALYVPRNLERDGGESLGPRLLGAVHRARMAVGRAFGLDAAYPYPPLTVLYRFALDPDLPANQGEGAPLVLTDRPWDDWKEERTARWDRSLTRRIARDVMRREASGSSSIVERVIARKTLPSWFITTLAGGVSPAPPAESSLARARCLTEGPLPLTRLRYLDSFPRGAQEAARAQAHAFGRFLLERYRSGEILHGLRGFAQRPFWFEAEMAKSLGASFDALHSQWSQAMQAQCTASTAAAGRPAEAAQAPLRSQVLLPLERGVRLSPDRTQRLSVLVAPHGEWGELVLRNHGDPDEGVDEEPAGRGRTLGRFILPGARWTPLGDAVLALQEVEPGREGGVDLVRFDVATARKTRLASGSRLREVRLCASGRWVSVLGFPHREGEVRIFALDRRGRGGAREVGRVTRPGLYTHTWLAGTGRLLLVRRAGDGRTWVLEQVRVARRLTGQEGTFTVTLSDPRVLARFARPVLELAAPVPHRIYLVMPDLQGRAHLVAVDGMGRRPRVLHRAVAGFEAVQVTRRADRFSFVEAGPDRAWWKEAALPQPSARQAHSEGLATAFLGTASTATVSEAKQDGPPGAEAGHQIGMEEGAYRKREYRDRMGVPVVRPILETDNVGALMVTRDELGSSALEAAVWQDLEKGRTSGQIRMALPGLTLGLFRSARLDFLDLFPLARFANSEVQRGGILQKVIGLSPAERLAATLEMKEVSFAPGSVGPGAATLTPTAHQFRLTYVADGRRMRRLAASNPLANFRLMLSAATGSGLFSPQLSVTEGVFEVRGHFPDESQGLSLRLSGGSRGRRRGSAYPVGFSAGGIGTVRGVRAGGLQGKKILAANVEWRETLSRRKTLDRLGMERLDRFLYFDRILCVLFLDAGVAGDSKLDLAGVQKGVGAELRLRSNLAGLREVDLRLGVARGLDDQGESRGYLATTTIF